MEQALKIKHGTMIKEAQICIDVFIYFYNLIYIIKHNNSYWLPMLL